MQYKQYIARAGNLPIENNTLDALYFTADANVDEFAGELLEALRILKSGGQAVIETSGADITAACARAKLSPPSGVPDGSGAILTLTRS